MLSHRRAFALFALSSAFLSIGAACGGSADGPDAVPADGADSGLPDSRSNDANTQNDARGQDAEPDAFPDDAIRLAEGEITIHGVTTDDRVIVSRKTSAGTTALEAIQLATGATSTILAPLPAGAWVSVKGNAVALWSNVATTGVGRLSLWTAESNLATDVEDDSPGLYFWASNDGKRVAYYGNVTTNGGDMESAELVARDTDTGESETVLTGDQRISFAEDACSASIGFVGTTILATYCSITNPQARLVTIPATGTKSARFLVGGLYSFWSADAAGSKIFVIADDLQEGMVVSNDGSDPPTIASFEFDVEDGFMTKDGSAVVYRAGTALRRFLLTGAGAGTSVTIANDEARHVWGVSSDQKHILFNSLPGRPLDPQNPDGQRFVDLQIVDTTATEVDARTLVATETALPLGFSGNDAHALFFSNGPKLNVVGVDGTAPRSTSVRFNVMDVTPAGSGGVVSENERTESGTTVVDLVHVDFTVGDPTSDALVRKPIAEGVVSGGYAFGKLSPKTFAFVRAGDERGLYRTSLP